MRYSSSAVGLLAGTQGRPDVAQTRAAWKKGQTALDMARLVFIDEAGTAINMAR